MTRQAPPRVLEAIRSAAHRTGVNFAYLMEQAAAESGFDAKAGSKSSSAKGLYQFIESTWLKMVKSYGAEHGLQKYAAMIDGNGQVADPQARKEILALRDDPAAAAAMAAEFAAENRDYLETYGGFAPEEIGSTELYFAHFLGAGGAAAFLKAYKDNPLANAADLFPQAARANRNVFYDPKTGQGRTLAGVYDFFAKKFGNSEIPAPQVATDVSRVPAVPLAQPQPLYDVLALDMASRRPLYDVLSGSAGAKGGWGAIPALSPSQILLMARLDLPGTAQNGL